MKKRMQALKRVSILFIMLLGLIVINYNLSVEASSEAETYTIGGTNTVTVSSAGTYQYYQFTTPEKEGHFFLQSKNISIPAHTTWSYANLYVEVYDSVTGKAIITNKHVRPDYGGDWIYSDCDLEPSTTYNVRVKASWSEDGDYKLPGELQYIITYKSDSEPDTMDEAESLNLSEEYQGTLVGNKDEDWFVLQTDDGTRYELYTKNIDVHTHTSWYYDELMYRATLYDENGITVTDMRLPITEESSQILELNPNSTYYIQIKNYCGESSVTRLEETGDYLISLGHPMITDADVVLEKTEYIYTGEEITPEVTVTYNGTKLIEDTDYTVKYTDNIEKGTGKVIVTGINGYGGVVTKTFEIGGYTNISMQEKIEGTVNEEITIAADIETNICVPDSENVTWTVHHMYDAETSFGTMSTNTIAEESYKISRTFKTNVPGKYELEVETKDGEIAKTTVLVKPAKVEEFTYINHVGWIRLGWKKMEDIDGYRIDYSWTENGTVQESQLIVSASLDEKDVKRLIRGEAYEFAIRAYKDVGDEMLYGEKVEIGTTIIDLPLTMDCWGFINPNLLIGMNKNYFKPYVPIAQADLFSWNGSYNGWRGLCYGLSKTAGQILIDNNPSVSTYGVESLNEYKSWSEVPNELQEKVKYAHASQIVYHPAVSGQEGGMLTDIMTICQGIDNYLYHDGFPVFLRIRKDTTGKDGHILWAQDYSLEKDGTIKIYVYDTNHPSSDQGVERILTLSGDNYENWRYEAGGTLGTYTGTTGTDANGGWTLGAGMYGETSLSNYYLLEVDTTNSSGDVDVTEFENVIVIDSYSETEETGESGKLYWISPQDAYKISSLPAGAKLTIAMKESTANIQVSAESTLDLTMDDNGTFQVEVTSETNNAIVTSFYEYEDNERIITTTTASSPAGNSVLIEKENDQLKITGIESLAITETTELDTEEGEYKKVVEENLDKTETLPGKEYIVEESENTSVLKEDTNGDGSFSTVVSEFKKQDYRILPAAPASAKAVLSGGHDDVKISWSASEYATGYDVYYKKSTASSYTFYKSVETTSCTIANLADNVTYKFKVVPYYSDGTNKYQDANAYVVASVMTKKNVAAPASLSAALYGYDDVKLTWTKSSGAVGYYVYYKKSADSSYTYLTSTTGLSVKKANLSDGVKYTFKVVPYYKNGSAKVPGYYNITKSIYTLKKLSVPTVSKGSSTKITVEWQNIAGESGYQLSKSTSKTGTSIVSTTSGTSKTFAVTRNKTYYYKVRAYKTVGSTKIYGPWSDVKAYNLRYVASQGIVTAVLYGHDDVKLSWKKVTGANYYHVYYKKSSDASYTKLGSTTSTSYKKAGLTDGVKYTFKVVPTYKSSGKILAQGNSKTVSIYTMKKLSVPAVTKYSSSKVKVAWNNISGETGYQISQSTSKTGTKIVATYTTTSGKSKTVTAKKGTTYYYKVRAYKTVGSTKIYGPWSDVTAYKLK